MSIKTIHIPAGGGFDHVTVGSTQPVEPGAGEITVRVRASSLNFHDYMVVKGITGPSERRIPMADGAGEVTAVGEGVTEFAVGDHVVSTFFPEWLDGEAPEGGFSRVPGDGVDGFAREQVTAPVTAFTHAPRGWSHAEAATLTTAGLTAWRALMEDGALQPGQVVLVQGTGGVSVFALQLAKLAGARVIATSSSDAKLERLRELGADEVINYRQDPKWGETAHRLAGGRGVDHVLDVAGSDTLEQSMLACRAGGHVSLIGVLTGVDVRFPLGLALGRQLRLQGLVVGSRRQQQDLVRAMEACTLRPVIDRHFALDDLVAAFRHQESGAHFGKIVLDI
ncbi:NAD(P)-dependent alcohol dehydrogenase [Luteimonas sp. MJ174]|uniref:zinc-dependent alcohol dehydrogenase family protein n=1 Tax=Luteimonas sp. MJ174 TaxID=3129237 RepID=UPI0031BA0723